MPPPEWYAGYGPEGCHMDSPPMNGLLDTALSPGPFVQHGSRAAYRCGGGGASLSSPLGIVAGKESPGGRQLVTGNR